MHGVSYGHLSVPRIRRHVLSVSAGHVFRRPCIQRVHGMPVWKLPGWFHQCVRLCVRDNG